MRRPRCQSCRSPRRTRLISANFTPSKHFISMSTGFSFPWIFLISILILFTTKIMKLQQCNINVTNPSLVCSVSDSLARAATAPSVQRSLPRNQPLNCPVDRRVVLSLAAAPSPNSLRRAPRCPANVTDHDASTIRARPRWNTFRPTRVGDKYHASFCSCCQLAQVGLAISRRSSSNANLMSERSWAIKFDVITTDLYLAKSSPAGSSSSPGSSCSPTPGETDALSETIPHSKRADACTTVPCAAQLQCHCKALTSASCFGQRKHSMKCIHLSQRSVSWRPRQQFSRSKHQPWLILCARLVRMASYLLMCLRQRRPSMIFLCVAKRGIFPFLYDFLQQHLSESPTFIGHAGAVGGSLHMKREGFDMVAPRAATCSRWHSTPSSDGSAALWLRATSLSMHIPLLMRLCR